ncbi:MAG: phosphoribosyl-ATP diphosphatase [Actinomycetales bacterium]|nr:phosphoribosyl-ATP diphosphatase [Actinomycetales bacterium]
MPTVEQLWDTLAVRAASGDPGSRTVALLDAGVHAVGKKVVEEAAESWLAAEYEGPERTAQEVAQLIYHALVLLMASGASLDEVHAHL